MRGLHCMADLRGCMPSRFESISELLDVCKAAVRAAGLTVVAEQCHTFPPSSDLTVPCGATLTLLLAESHLCVHTWPELGGATIDAYVCNVHHEHSAQAVALIDALVAWFAPSQCLRQSVQRGFQT